MRMRLALALSLLLGPFGVDAVAQTPEADPGLLEEGRYLVVAGDCASCHGTTLAGGASVPTPIGDIRALNITPDPETGIGGWTLRQFSGVLRRGVAPDGHLYPAMPYTSYTGLADAQIRAIYSYLMLGVEPVPNATPRTELPFPFVRPAMIVWDALFLRRGKAVGAVPVTGEQEARGQMLVEALGHCTTCHTPRGQLMQEVSSRHLGGAMTNGWWAPNITPDPSGIGTWSDEQLTAFLSTGHTDVAVAADDMADAVTHSLSLLPPEDIAAIIAYLRAVPPLASDRQSPPLATPPAPVTVAAIEPAGVFGWEAMLAYDTTDGALLYQNACASCHGAGGSGSAELAHPSLRLVNGVTVPEGTTLVQVIAQGVDRTVDGWRTFMPGFRDSLNDAQIASLANFVRTQFGGVEGALDAEQVKTILAAQLETPWLIRNAVWLSVVGIVVALIVVAVIVWATIRFSRRRKRRHVPA